MKILVACEYSSRVRNAFLTKGHDVWSCDLLEAEDSSDRHIIGDVIDVLAQQHFDLMIAHPPCTYLAVSGLHWNKRRPGRQEQTEKALEFVRLLMNANIEKICIENPVSCISTRIRKPDQIIQPWWFGDDASKKTCLWLKNLPVLVATNRLPGDEKTRRANQTKSGQNNIPPGINQWRERSRTYQGIAFAMVEQWG